MSTRTFSGKVLTGILQVSLNLLFCKCVGRSPFSKDQRDLSTDGGTRTPDHGIKSPTLYTTELRRLWVSPPN